MIKVRLYILRALKLAAMDEGWGDQPGRSDPYLGIELGKHVYDGRDQHFDDLVDVDFYTYIGLNTEILARACSRSTSMTLTTSAATTLSARP